MISQYPGKLVHQLQKECTQLELSQLIGCSIIGNSLFVLDDGSLVYPNKQQKILQGHDMQITAVAVRQDLIATGQVGSNKSKNYDAPIYLWNSTKKNLIKILIGLKQSVKHIFISDNCKYLVASSTKNHMIVWELTNYSIVNQRVWEQSISLLGFTNKIVFSIGHSLNQMVLAHPQPVISKYVLPSTGLPRTFTCAVLKPDGTDILATSSGELIVFQKGNFKKVYTVGKGSVSAMASIQNQLYICSGQQLAKIKLTPSSLIQQRRTSITYLSSLRFTKNYLYAGTKGAIYQINTNTLEAKYVTQGHLDSICSIAFFKGFLVTAAKSNALVWTIKDQTLVMRCKAISGITCAAISQDFHVVLGFSDGFIRAYKISDKLQPPIAWQIANAHKKFVSSVFCNENYILSGGADSVVRIWSRSARQLLNQISIHQKQISRVFPDKYQPHVIHSCSHDKSISSYQLKSDKKVAFHQDKNGIILDMVQHQNQLVTCGYNCPVSFWQSNNFYPASTIQIPFKCLCVDISEGGYYAIGIQTGQILIYKQKKYIGKKQAHSMAVSQLRWAQKYLYAGSEDGSISKWKFTP